MSDSSNPNDGVQQAPGFNFQVLYHVLLEKAWIVLFCFIVAVFLTGAYLKRAPRIYAASVVLQVEQEESRVMKIEKIQGEDLRWPDILKTIEQTLQSRSLFERIVEVNNLTSDPRFLDATGQSPSKDQLAGMLAGMTTARLRRGTRLIDVTVAHTNPELTALVANSLVREYMRQNVEQRATSTGVANDFLMEEAQRLKKKLQESENALQAYKEKTQSVSLEERQNIVVQRLKELSLKVTEAKSVCLKLESELAQVDKSGTNIDALLIAPAVAGDSSVASIQLTLSKLEADFATLKQRYKDKHPKYIQAVSEMAEWRKSFQEAVFKVPQTLHSAYDSAKASEQAMERALHEQETAALDLNKQSIQYNVLSREVESDRLLYDAVVQRMKETSLTKELQPDKIRVVQSAIVPKAPFKPETTKVMLQGLIGGFVFGLMLALFLHSLDTSFKSVDQTESYLGLPVLSVIPQVKASGSGKGGLVVAEDAKSTGAESFRSLRTSLSMLGREEQRRVFLITSAMPQDGTTFCSLNYAASLAQSGLRTVIIDCDLRRPSVEKILTGGRSSHPGVTDFLTGKTTLPDLIQETKIEKLSFISAGTVAPNPAELLTRNSIDALVEDALQQFERVVIDSAPIHAVSDTLLILNRVQTVCLVARACKTPRKSVLRALQVLQKAHAPLAGLILNRLPRRRGLEYYYDSYYDYSYRGKYTQKGVYGEA